MIKLHVVVLLHHLVIVLAIFAAIGSFFTASLPVATGMLILVVRLGTSPAPCILTIIENRLRRKLGLPEIGGFVKHYYIKPLIRRKRVIRTAKRNRR